MIAAFGKANGVDLAAEGGGALTRLAQRVEIAIDDPASFETKTGVRQDASAADSRSAWAWLEPYCWTVKCTPRQQTRLASQRPLAVTRLGGDLSAVFSRRRSHQPPCAFSDETARTGTSAAMSARMPGWRSGFAPRRSEHSRVFGCAMRSRDHAARGAQRGLQGPPSTAGISTMRSGCASESASMRASLRLDRRSTSPASSTSEISRVSSRIMLMRTPTTLRHSRWSRVPPARIVPKPRTC